MATTPATAAIKAISALKSAEISSHDMLRIVLAALKKRDRFDPEDAVLCTNALLDKLRAVSIQDTLYRDSRGRLFVRGRPVKDSSIEGAIIKAAHAVQKNIARRLVKEKVEYQAAVLARSSTSIWDLLFVKAALWFSQEEDKVYADLTGLVDYSDDIETE